MLQVFHCFEKNHEKCNSNYFIDGPDDVNISPAYPEITTTEGNTLGPITCLAQCYPECDIVWERKTNGRFEQIGNIGTTATLFKSQASKVDSGQYRCTAIHQRDELRRSWKDVHVNVLCKYQQSLHSVVRTY